MKTNSVFIYLTAAIWAAVCFFKVHQSTDPSGGDGYFYLKQTEWLANHFSFYHADYSFIFFPLALLYKLTGSSLIAFQIVTTFSVFAISSALGLFFYKRALWIENVLLRLVTACLFTLVFAMQASVLKLSFEFAKNGLAQAFLLWGVCFYFDRKFRLSFILFLLAAATHKLAFLFVVLLLFYLLTKSRRTLKGLLLLGLISAVSLFALFPRLTKHLANFVDHFSFEKVFFLQFENQLMTKLLMVLTFLWLCFAVIQLKKSKDFKDPLQWALIVFSFVPFLPIFSGYNIEIKYRLFLLSFTFGAMAFVIACESLKNIKVQIMALAFSFTVLAYQAPQYNGFPWIMNWSEKIKNLDQVEARVQPEDEVVTQHGLQFYIDYKTKIRARSMLAASRKPKYQIAYTPEFYHLNDQLSDELRQIELVSLGASYGLFEFDDFQALMRQYPMMSDWRNQFQVRPDFVQDY